MRAFFFSLTLILSACGAPPAHQSHDTPASGAPAATTLEVRDGWAPPTPNGVDVSAGYVTIVNGTDAEDQLVSVSSPRAERVELHEMAMDGNVMRMRKVDRLAISAHGEASLAPHGQHLMFFGVTQAFAPGEQIPVTMTFAHAGQVETTLTVRMGGH
jgi:copper(I)-binding protein